MTAARRTRWILLAILATVVGVYAWNHLTGRSVEAQVRSTTGDRGAACYHAGVVAFAGAQEQVYECSMAWGTYRCFVRTGGELYDVTDQIGELKRVVVAIRGFRCGG